MNFSFAPKPDPLTHMAKSGALRLSQMAFAFACAFWLETGRLPDPQTVPAAVHRKWGKRMSIRTAYQGVKDFEKTLTRKDV